MVKMLKKPAKIMTMPKTKTCSSKSGTARAHRSKTFGEREH